MSSGGTIPEGTVLRLADLITATEHGIASRVLARSAGGNVTLFAFDEGETLTEHTTPFDALALTLEGELAFTIGGSRVDARPGTIVKLPANIPHAVAATIASRLLLIMLKDAKSA